VRLEGLGQLQNLMTSLGIEPRDLPACNIVPQPTILPCVPERMINNIKHFHFNNDIGRLCHDARQFNKKYNKTFQGSD
jgi:hypothetical protein